MISRPPIPTLVVVPAESGAGKTVAAGAVADALRRRGARVAVCVPVQSGAEHRREGLVSTEAEFLAVCAHARDPLDLICPQRFAEPMIPSVAARRAGGTLEWDSIDRSIRLLARDRDVLILQSPGPLMTPMDDKHTVLDMVRELGAPVLLVVRPGLDAIHGLVSSARALKDAKIKVIGFVVNRFPADSSSVSDELSLPEMEKWSKVPFLCALPLEQNIGPPLPAGITGVADVVDWRSRIGRG